MKIRAGRWVNNLNLLRTNLLGSLQRLSLVPPKKPISVLLFVYLLIFWGESHLTCLHLPVGKLQS